MEAIGQLIVAILSFVVEVLIATLGFVCRMLAAVFSLESRRLLKAEWQESAVNRIAMIMAGLISVMGVTMVLGFGMLFLKRKKPVEPLPAAAAGLQLEVKWTPQEGTGETVEGKSLLKTAGAAFKRKLEERREAKEAKAAEADQQK
jgi:hypothetical protein